MMFFDAFKVTIKKERSIAPLSAEFSRAYSTKESAIRLSWFAFLRKIVEG